jgi:hypothetical protein
MPKKKTVEELKLRRYSLTFGPHGTMATSRLPPRFRFEVADDQAALAKLKQVKQRFPNAEIRYLWRGNRRIWPPVRAKAVPASPA